MENLTQDIVDVQPTESVEPTTDATQGGTPEAVEAVEQDPVSTLKAEMDKLRTELKQQLDEKDKHWQSVKDREVKKASSEARDARLKAQEYETILSNLKRNPQVANQLQYLQSNAELERYRAMEKEKQVESEKNEFIASHMKYAEELGVDPNDKDIDWAVDAKGPTEASKRILTSIAKVQKKQIANREKELEGKLKEMEQRMRKELGFDSIDKTSEGSVPGSFTRSQIREMSAEEYEKNYDKIQAAYSSGKILDK